MAPFSGQPTHAQQVALALTPKITASLSILGSSYIVGDCLKKLGRQKRGASHQQSSTNNNIYHLLLVGLSVCDLFMSAGLFTSTWPMPKDTPNVVWAAGTVKTCEAVGFFEQAGVAAVLYNGSLSTYYLLRIKNGWTPSQLSRIEPLLHLVPIVYGLTTMVASLALGLFNSGIWDCWIATYPQGCQESWRNGGVSTCTRGDNASLYQWIFDVIPKWLSVLLVTVNMLLIHRAVWLRERSTMHYSMNQYRTSSSSSSSRLRRPSVAKQLARQSYLYVGALYITYIPVIVTRVTELITGYVYYGMLLTISITIPLQGFWNLIVYLRPRYLQARKRQQRARRQQNSGPPSSGGASRPSFSFLRAVSEAVKEGDLSEKQEEEEEDNEAPSVEQHRVEETETDAAELGEEQKEELTHEAPLSEATTTGLLDKIPS